MDGQYCSGSFYLALWVYKGETAEKQAKAVRMKFTARCLRFYQIRSRLQLGV